MFRPARNIRSDFAFSIAALDARNLNSFQAACYTRWSSVCVAQIYTLAS